MFLLSLVLQDLCESPIEVAQIVVLLEKRLRRSGALLLINNILHMLNFHLLLLLKCLIIEILVRFILLLVFY